jgi:hypothetical protein
MTGTDLVDANKLRDELIAQLQQHGGSTIGRYLPALNHESNFVDREVLSPLESSGVLKVNRLAGDVRDWEISLQATLLSDFQSARPFHHQ